MRTVTVRAFADVFAGGLSQRLSRMDYAISWGGEPEDVRLTAWGVADIVQMDAMMAEAVADPRWVAGMRVLFDYARLDFDSLSTIEAQERAEQIKDMAEAFGHQRVALVTDVKGSYRKARLIGLLLDRQVGFEAHFFDSLPEAQEWLRDAPEDKLPHIAPRW